MNNKLKLILKLIDIKDNLIESGEEDLAKDLAKCINGFEIDYKGGK